jgi:hypothetical protein
MMCVYSRENVKLLVRGGGLKKNLYLGLWPKLGGGGLGGSEGPNIVTRFFSKISKLIYML